MDAHLSQLCEITFCYKTWNSSELIFYNSISGDSWTLYNREKSSWKKVWAQGLSSAEESPWAKKVFYCVTCIKFNNHNNEYIFTIRKLIMITVQQWPPSIDMYMGSSVDKSICPKCRVSWVQIPPEATHFHFFIASGVLTFFFSFFLSSVNMY